MEAPGSYPSVKEPLIACRRKPDALVSSSYRGSWIVDAIIILLSSSGWVLLVRLWFPLRAATAAELSKTGAVGREARPPGKAAAP